jgi:hypothetical protein
MKVLLLFLLTVFQQIAAAKNVAQPKPEDATRAMILLFDHHNVLMLGEIHSNKQEYEWLCRLVKDSGFSDRVDDIVIEFGNALYQKDVDRYVAGGDVPFGQVQKAWRNMIVSVPPDPAHQFGNLTLVIGDPRLYSRIYIGTNGRGIIYGDINTGQ